jgi:C-terminal region of band_7
VVSVAISHGDVAALNYFIADKYIRAFGELARSPNQKVLMMPLEATAMLGSLAGIAEIARDALHGQGGTPASATPRTAVPQTPPPPPRPAS